MDGRKEHLAFQRHVTRKFINICTQSGEVPFVIDRTLTDKVRSFTQSRPREGVSARSTSGDGGGSPPNTGQTEEIPSE